MSYLIKGTSHRYISAGTKVKVICKGQGQISRLHFFKKKKKKNGCFGGISVSQTHLITSFVFQNGFMFSSQDCMLTCGPDKYCNPDTCCPKPKRPPPNGQK